jgi:nucleotide-binding universal stress UspA family protein
MNEVRSLLALASLHGGRERAVDRAALICAELGVPLALLHVDRPTRPAPWRRWFAARRHAAASAPQAHETLSALAAQIAARCRIDVAHEVVSGDVFEQLRRRAAPDTRLVLGAGGANDMREHLLGSTAERLLDAGSAPMLVARRPARQPYHRVLVASDLMPSSKRALRFAATLAPRAEITLFHAIELSHEAEMRLAGIREPVIRRHRGALHAAAGMAARSLVASLASGDDRIVPAFGYGDARRSILHQQACLDAELIAVGQRSVSSLREALFGSMATRLLAASSCDLLVVPVAARRHAAARRSSPQLPMPGPAEAMAAAPRGTA